MAQAGICHWQMLNVPFKSHAGAMYTFHTERMQQPISLSASKCTSVVSAITRRQLFIQGCLLQDND